MRGIFAQLRLPAIISSLLVLPFVGLEMISRRSFGEEFPFPLFGILWLLPVAVVLTVRSIVRDWRATDTVRTLPLSLLPKVAFLVVVVWLWGVILLDQMPCFLGVPRCD